MSSQGLAVDGVTLCLAASRDQPRLCQINGISLDYYTRIETTEVEGATYDHSQPSGFANV